MTEKPKRKNEDKPKNQEDQLTSGHIALLIFCLGGAGCLTLMLASLIPPPSNLDEFHHWIETNHQSIMLCGGPVLLVLMILGGVGNK